MTFILERTIRLSPNTEHTNLYKWSLHEVGQSGEKVSRDLIPYDSTLRFFATDLRLFSEMKLSRVVRGDSWETELHTSQVLVADLRFDPKYSAEDSWAPTKLSMLGTDRIVSAMRLRVEQTVDGSAAEECNLWASPSYKTDIDFRSHTIPDTLELTVRVSPSRYRELCELSVSPHAISLDVYVSRVAGLYSAWSPAIGTDLVKILTNHKEHVVEHSGVDAQPPRVGEVGEFTFSIVRHGFVSAVKSIPSDAASETEAPGAVAESASVDEGVSALRTLRTDVVGIRQAVSVLAVPAWIIAIVLALSFIF